jgi:uncharacterized protein
VETRLTLPVRQGAVQLPGMGGWTVGKRETVPIMIGGSAYRLPEDAEPMLVRRLNAEGISVALEDTDPSRDCHQWPASSRLDDADFELWQRMFGEAWALIRRELPAYAPGLAAGLATIVPLAPAPPGREVSSTARQAFGSVAIALPDGPDVLALLLIHEFQHAKLGAVLDVFDLYDESDDRLYHAPWREDPRPLEGLLQGTYAHVAVVDYWRVRSGLTGDAGAEEAFTRWRGHTAAAIQTLRDSGSLTGLGERFAAGMGATMAPWFDEP